MDIHEKCLFPLPSITIVLFTYDKGILQRLKELGYNVTPYKNE